MYFLFVINKKFAYRLIIFISWNRPQLKTGFTFGVKKYITQCLVLKKKLFRTLCRIKSVCFLKKKSLLSACTFDLLRIDFWGSSSNIVVWSRSFFLTICNPHPFYIANTYVASALRRLSHRDLLSVSILGSFWGYFEFTQGWLWVCSNEPGVNQ